MSTARTVLRNLWLLDFVYEFISLVYLNRNAKPSTCATEAYNRTLKHHHSWALRNGAKLGLLSLPSREHFMSSTGITYDHLSVVKENMYLIKENLWNFYRQRGITNLE